MIKKAIKPTIKHYMDMITCYETFIPPDAIAVGKTIKEVESYGVKVLHYHLSPIEIDNELFPSKDLELMVGMSINFEGKRKAIKKLCESLNLP